MNSKTARKMRKVISEQSPELSKDSKKQVFKKAKKIMTQGNKK